MCKRTFVFSVMIGSLLIAIGSLLAQAELTNWALVIVGALLVAVATVQALQTQLKPATIRIESNQRKH